MSAPIPVFSDRPKAAPTPKLRALVKFPGNIEATKGIEVTKANGTYTFETDWTDFGSISAIPTSPTSYILTFDTATGEYVLVPSHLLGGAMSGIADVTVAGTYARSPGSWVSTDFLQSGTGAVARTAIDKARDILNVLDFGAVPNNSLFDNKVAFEKAFAEQVSSGKSLKIPAGVWWFSTLLYPGAPGGPGHINQGMIYGDGGLTVLRQFAANKTQDCWVFNDIGVNALGDLTVKDISIVCEVDKTAGRGMFFNKCARITLDGVLMRGDNRMYDGIEFYGIVSMIMKRCKIFNPVRDGIIAYTGDPTNPLEPGGAGLFIDESNLVSGAGRDGISFRGGIGGIHIECHVYLPVRYGCMVTRSGTNVRNRDITFSPNCSLDGCGQDGIHFDTSSVEMVKIQGGWHASPIGGGSGAAIQINYQGPCESAGRLGMPTLFHIVGTTNVQGSGPGVAWSDNGELKIDSCDFSYRIGPGIFLGPPAGTGIVEITNNKIIHVSSGAGIQSNSYPQRCNISGNMIYACAGGALNGVPSTPDGTFWVGVIANNVIA